MYLRLTVIFVLLLSYLLIAFIQSKISFMVAMGYLAGGAIIIPSILNLRQINLKNITVTVPEILLLMLVIYILINPYHFNTAYLKTLILTAYGATLFYVSSRWADLRRYFKFFEIFLLSGLLVITCDAILMLDRYKTEWYFSNSNSFGLYVFFIYSLVFLLSERRRTIIFASIMGIILIYLSGSRSSMLALLILISYNHLVPRIMLKWPRTTVAIFMVFSGITIYLYVILSLTPLGKLINVYVFNYTNKNLFTGRNKIWLEIFSTMKLSITGLGFGANASDIIGGDYSSHSSFVQMYLNGGLIGLTLFIPFIISAVRSHSRHNGLVVAIIFISLWEVLWFQNSPGSYLYIMILLGLKISRDRHVI